MPITRKCSRSGRATRSSVAAQKPFAWWSSASGPRAAPVEQRDLHAAFGKREAPADDVFEHEARVSRRARADRHPRPRTKAILRARVSYDDALRDRVRAHLARFERHTHARDELRAAAVALALLPDDDGAPASC